MMLQCRSETNCKPAGVLSPTFFWCLTYLDLPLSPTRAKERHGCNTTLGGLEVASVRSWQHTLLWVLRMIRNLLVTFWSPRSLYFELAMKLPLEARSLWRIV